MYYTYLLRCQDNSIYTGITTNLQRRMQEHFQQGEKCAKYTLRHKPKKFEIAFESEDRVLASKLEYHIKKSLSKQEKEELITGEADLSKFFGEKIECEKYKVIKNNFSN